MATHAHCVACFDALYSELVKRPLSSREASNKTVLQEHNDAKKTWRKPMSLEEIEKSWAQYKSLTEKKLPALERLLHKATGDAASDSSGSSTPSSSSSSSLFGNGASASAADTPATSTTSLPDEEPITESPLFVTWDTKLSDNSKELRGCIGTFESLPLSEGLPSYALTSAFDDHRFDEMQFSERKKLVVSVTLLTNFEPCADWKDWEIGTHGIKIKVRSSSGRSYSATYLPQVAPEQGWNHEQTLSSLMRKAGWHGSRDAWKSVDFETTRYQGKKVDMEWKDYKAWRDWADSQEA